MAICLFNTSSCALCSLKKTGETQLPRRSSGLNCNTRSRIPDLSRRNKRGVVASCFFNPTNQPILREALKEPVAFLGGMFAGLLRLDLNEEPLKEWVTRTAEASGLTEEGIEAEGSKPEEEVPRQIEIE